MELYFKIALKCVPNLTYTIGWLGQGGKTFQINSAGKWKNWVSVNCRTQKYVSPYKSCLPLKLITPPTWTRHSLPLRTNNPSNPFISLSLSLRIYKYLRI